MSWALKQASTKVAKQQPRLCQLPVFIYRLAGKDLGVSFGKWKPFVLMIGWQAILPKIKTSIPPSFLHTAASTNKHNASPNPCSRTKTVKTFTTISKTSCRFVGWPVTNTWRDTRTQRGRCLFKTDWWKPAKLILERWYHRWWPKPLGFPQICGHGKAYNSGNWRLEARWMYDQLLATTKPLRYKRSSQCCWWAVALNWMSSKYKPGSTS